LSQVNFHYTAADLPALHQVSLTIPAGQITALVGPSGAGKSSLVNLLTRLYDPSDGQVLVDGIDLRDLEIGSWRQRVAVVSQDVFLFHDTIRVNLRFARLDATDEQIVHACQLAQAHEFISAMPEGYETVVQDRGARLSGGQRQRLALARALLVEADLLILDEATSELDGPTEQAIQQALTQHWRGRTALVIAHRLSTVAQADNIYVLEAGRVVEQGRHEDLLAQAGPYARLVKAHQLVTANA
jgi:ABC-type multidrug transport system fused ATPase/permease subunit